MASRLRRGTTLIAATISLAAFAAGCGGGGGIHLPTPTTTAALTIDWPARSRDITNVPASALSAVIVIAGANPGGGDATFAVNRDSSQLGAHNETYSQKINANPGIYNVTVNFYALANGGGGLVGKTGAVSVTIDSPTTTLGAVAVVGTVASVTVADKQTVGIGTPADLNITVKDANGAALAAITPGSVKYAEKDGLNLLTVRADGALQGVTAGLAQVTAKVDGIESAPVTVGVGNPTIPITTSGSRGSVAITAKAVDLSTNASATTSLPAGGGNTVSFVSGWFFQNTVTAPSGYGDRTFSKWTRNGATVSTTTGFTFFPTDANGTSTLTANYVSRSVPNPTNTDPTTHFQPNYNQSTELNWDPARFPGTPLKVYFGAITDSSVVARIKKGFDRWVNATGSVISYTTVSSAGAADITVELGAVESSPGEQGLTTITLGGPVSGPFHITHGDISILSTAPSTPAFGPNHVDPLEVLAAHEFGHVLGLTAGNGVGATAGGHSDDPNDTMFAGLNVTTSNSITERDINSLENLYPSKF